MSRKIDDDKKKKDEEELKQLLESLKQTNDFNKEDVEKLSELLHNVLKTSKHPIRSKFIGLTTSFLIKYVVFYVLSIVTFGLLISGVIMTNKYMIFIASLVTALILAVFETLPYIQGKKNAVLTIGVFAVIAFDLCLLNNIIPVFTNSFTWIAFVILIEVLYFMAVSHVVRRKLYS